MGNITKGLRVGTRVFGAGALLLIAACGTLSALHSPSSQYRAYVNDKVQSKKLYERGHEILSVKVVPATKVLKDAQEKLTPGHGFEYKEQMRQVVIAAGFPSASDFAAQDLKITLGGRNFEWIHEVDSRVLEETHYFFSYPFHRVFIVDFSKPDARVADEELEIKSPRGPVKFQLHFDDAAGT